MITLELLHSIRAKGYTEAFIFLVDFYNANDNVFLRLTNFKEDVRDVNLYKEYPFLINIPNFSQASSSQLFIYFANVIHNGVRIKNVINQVKKVSIKFTQANNTSLNLYPKDFFYFGEGDSFAVDQNIINIDLSKKIFQNTFFPFFKYNSITHPSLYLSREYYDA